MPQSFHHSQFTDIPHLISLKKSQKITICIPTLNEAATIGPIVEIIRQHLIEKHPLIDELLVIDSHSTDNTLEIARNAGATTHLSAEIAPETGTHTGKGENLWKALHIASGDIICYLDADVTNFASHFVTGLIGPLLTHPELHYIKAHYTRPIQNGETLHPNGGGRVSEILVRPLLTLFYPELAALHQPLAGEYAARRSLLETLPFPTGYGVEIAHLIDILASGKIHTLAQTDLDQRIHRNRPTHELTQTSLQILQAILPRLHRDGKLPQTPIPPNTERPPGRHARQV